MLYLRSINDLNHRGYVFYIAAYQRGYRWRKEEVIKLLKDIWNFDPNANPNSFYCLQPLVVKDRGNNTYEVIDGQQRLTTCLIIQQAIFDFGCSYNAGLQSILNNNPGSFNVTNPSNQGSSYQINYASRDPSTTWLSNRLNRPLMLQNIDYYHIIEAYDATIAFLKELSQGTSQKPPFAHPENKLSNTLLNYVKFIWYEPIVNNSVAGEVEIFNRLNVGKINLNNAELIKAILLQEGNYSDNPQNDLGKEHIVRRQQIAHEWDSYEHELEDSAFWYFIYDTHSALKYETKIEYIFDLIYDKTTKNFDDYYFTFNKVSDRYEYWLELKNAKTSSKVPIGEKNFIDEIWNKVYDLMQTLHGWYDNRVLYHRIGYLIEQGVTIPEILDMQKKCNTYSSFKNKLDDRIRKITQAYKCGDLYKGKKGLTPMLLLFNVLTEDNSPNPNARFPFDSFKKCKGWDQEHVTPNTDFDPSNEGHRLQFIRQMLEYFTGISYSTCFDEAEIELIQKLVKQPANSKIYKEADTVFKQKVFNYLFRNLCHTNPEECKLCIRMLRLWKNSDKVNNQSGVKKQNAKNNLIIESKKCYNDVVIKHIFNNNTNSNDSLTTQDEKDFIWNQVLLDYRTNRSYGNAIFPFKRKCIIDNDAKHIFVPIGTKNVFLKVYSTRLSDMKKWGKLDAKAYLDVLKSTLKDYLNPTLQWPYFTI